MRAALLVVLLSGCAIGSVTLPDGTELRGVALGAAAIECCQGIGHIAPSTGEKEGSVTGPCQKITGGDLSQSASQVAQGAVEGVILWLSGGASKIASVFGGGG